MKMQESIDPNLKTEKQRSQLEDKLTSFKALQERGALDLSSEATARSWIEDLLRIFGWDPLNPFEVDQEIYLSEEAQQNLEEIRSSHKKPDYLLCNGDRHFIFIDAKKIGDDIKENKKNSFQIRSYGWSAGHPCAIVTNFKEIAIYDCRFKPNKDDNSDVARVEYLDASNYLEKFDVLSKHLDKERVMESELSDLYGDISPPKGTRTLDKDFSEHIREWRLKIANELFKNHNDFSIEKISYITQVLIDRILFLRVAEGLKIEGNNKLIDLTNPENDTAWEALRNHFSVYCSKRYSGSLFSDIQIFQNVNLSILNIHGFIETLYYPYPYRFDVITPNLLGNIYERYLGRKLVLRGSQVSDAFKEEYQKTKGAVYTPATIVQHICEQTIGPLLEKKTFTALTDLRICDPACGSGSFLLGAFDFLLFEMTRRFSTETKYNQKKYGHWFWINPRNGRVYTKTSAKRTILNRCIFGLDIDAQAVEISKLSLSLKALENLSVEPGIFMELGLLENGVLQGIGKNIRLGNALIDSKIFSEIPELAEDLDQIKKLKPFDWGADDIMKQPVSQEGGFHAIIGNPPYIEVKHYKKDLPAMHTYLANDADDREYKSCGTGKTDISMPFIEKGLKLLRPEGRLGFIVQNRFFKTQYGANSRRMLGESRAIEKIVDFGSLKIFPERTTYTCILLLAKSKKKKRYSYCRIEKREKLEAQLVEPKKYGVKTYDLDNELGADTWFFGPPELLALREKLKKQFGTIGDFKKDLSVNVGLQVLYKKIYYIKGRERGGLVSGKNLLGGDVVVESAATQPLVVNRDFYAFKKLKKENFVVFPYERMANASTALKAISAKRLEENYPKTFEYLKRNENFIKENVETLSGSKWFLYKYEKNHESQGLDKVLIPSTLKDLVATVDIGMGFFQDNVRVNSIQLKKSNKIQYKAICAIINSRLFDCLAKITAERLDNGYFQMNRQFLEPVPMPIRKIISGNALIVTLSEINDALTAASENYVGSDNYESKSAAKAVIRELQNKLDDAVEKELYELNAEEREIVSINSNRLRFDEYIEFIRGATSFAESEDEQEGQFEQ